MTDADMARARITDIGLLDLEDIRSASLIKTNDFCQDHFPMNSGRALSLAGRKDYRDRDNRWSFGDRIGPPMELVRAAALTGYFDVAAGLRLDVVPLLRKSGLSRAMMSNPEQMLPAVPVIGLLEDSALASGCLTFGLKMADHRRLSDIGLMSLLIVHQATLADAIGILAEYRNRINSTLTLQREEHEEVVFLREHIALNTPMICRQVSDLALGVLYKMCRSIMPERWRPQCVCFSYERPGAQDRATHDRLFDCPMQFGSDFDGIVIAREDLERPLPRADEAMAALARELITAVVDPGRRTLTEEVEQSIRLLMPSGRAAIGEVAHSLGLNLRTLQRRLEQEGVSFKDLMDRMRMQQVAQHLGNRQLRLTDVAHLLGYAELASFSAWYRSRFKKTPSEGRRILVDTGVS